MHRKAGCAVSDADAFAGFPSESLSDADAGGNSFPVFPKPLYRVNQAPVADGAGGVRRNMPRKFSGNAAGVKEGLLLVFCMMFMDYGF